MSIGESIIFGLIQGLTEFLPVSSSGHLTIFHKYLGSFDNNVLYDVILHFGTLFATLLFFHKKIFTLLTGFFQELKAKEFRGNNTKQILFIFLATLPTAIIGIVFKKQLEALFTQVQLVCYMLIVTGSILLITRFIQTKDYTISQLGFIKSIAIGIIQGCAIIPGISRSGSTISSGLFFGMDRKEAGEFSFLISIPAISGAVLLKVMEIQSFSSINWFVIGVGFLSSFITGLLSLALLMTFVKKGNLWFFAPYCILLGAGYLIFV